MDISELAQRILDRRDGEDGTLRIVQAGHPALRRRGQDVLVDGGAHATDADLASASRLEPALLLRLAEAMTVTMRKAPGVGLAAPQIGLPLRLFVLEDPFAAAAGEDADDDLHERTPLPLRCLLDPAYEALDADLVFAYEGCLSVDGWQSIVPRARRVHVSAIELLGDGTMRRIHEEHRGWPARILQHETDHLDGTLCHDRAVPRSFVDSRYAARYTVEEAVDRLGLTGPITRLTPGAVVLPGGAAQD